MDTGYRVSVLTLFPDIVDHYFRTSIVGKAVDRGALQPDVVNIRDFAEDKHRTCDDAPYGGGAGMVLLPGPLAKALDSVDAHRRHVVFPTPSGVPFRQSDAARLAATEDLVLICGRYEGIDQRIIDEYVNEEISIGDYVLSSGELAAMVIIDALYRLREGTIRRESVEEDSFQDGLLEHPHYTRPVEFHGRSVPDVLLSGHHEQIAGWRRREKIRKTARVRPDLLAAADLHPDEIGFATGVLEHKGVEDVRNQDG
ncbi:MAG: tRNA (guanosine(37)-N1)-methyltransferase TrmD [Spirochaeta sp.]|jgi:tRNA (guanine37-N1)-methyltransferase|nr:tRNA (guanosine(37)-N1)-methyltransferase TrmD [Spirochaeta sp.]